jgi:hypothetical protein
MTSARQLAYRCACAAGLFLLGSVVFAAIYGLAPLYYSNQNQYFVHGLARAGDGVLAEDWLAKTADPTPVFTALVALTVQYAHPWLFYAYHALLLGAYAGVALGLFVVLAGPNLAVRRWPVFVALILLIHSGLVRWLSYQVVGFDYPWFFQAGVAGQYVLGAMLQPSVFGVLLLVAVWLFVRDQPLLAAVCTALAVTLHSTYLLPAALLTLGFGTSLLLEKRSRLAFAVGGLTLALVLPTVIDILIRFGPTSAETFAEAQDILANYRIPHHARPDLWFDWVAGVQIAWVVVALILVRKHRLFPVLIVPFVLAVLLTLVQVATGSNTLALLFPWRISVVLVPIATAVILTRLVAIPTLPLATRAVTIASLVVVAGLVAAGVAIVVNKEAFNTGDKELAVMDFVRRTRSSGEVYFLPVQVPDPANKTRGSLSSDFMPLAQKRRNTQIIPIDLQRFRLRAEAPIYVDFKSIPYRDTEVIEWRERLRVTQSIMDLLGRGELAEVVSELRRIGVTHLVRPAGKELDAEGVPKVYDDGVYQVYRLDGTSSED